MRLGLDIGFGDVKAVLQDGRCVTLPTAVAPQSEAAVDLRDLRGLREGPIAYGYKGNAYEVGHTALSRSIPTRSIDFLLEYSPVLLAAVLRELGVRPSHVCVGLALNYYETHRHELQRCLERFRVNDEDYHQKVLVLPQGVGCLADWMLDERGTRRPAAQTRGEGLLIDIGFNTIDALTFRDCTIREAHPFDRAGVSKIIDELSDLLSKEFGYRPSLQKAKAIFLDQRAQIAGENRSLQSQVAKLTDRYFKHLMYLIQDRFGDKILELDWLVMAGGGAYYVGKYMPPRFAGQLVHLRQPEFANARGFLHVLLSANCSAPHTAAARSSSRGVAS